MSLEKGGHISSERIILSPLLSAAWSPGLQRPLAGTRLQSRLKRFDHLGRSSLLVDLQEQLGAKSAAASMPNAGWAVPLSARAPGLLWAACHSQGWPAPSVPEFRVQASAEALGQRPGTNMSHIVLQVDPHSTAFGLRTELIGL